MPNRQIPREEWSAFLEGFTRRHEGWLVSVRFLSPAVGWIVESHQLAVQGVSSDREGSSISVHLGASPVGAAGDGGWPRLRRRRSTGVIPELEFFLRGQEKTGTPRIVTVTVNPAVDESAVVEEIVPDRKLRCADLRREPGQTTGF